jgi:hypothetical protein
MVMQTGNSEGPTHEIGYSMASPITWDLWSADINEHVAELRWPRSLQIYQAMRSDAQIFSLLQSLFLPIRRSRWVIDPNGARDEVVEMVAHGLGLPVRGQDEPASRSRIRFNHDSHLEHSLLALVYGFMFFEIIGDVDKSPVSGKDQWQLQKLGPRMPQSIAKINLDKQTNELASIQQWPRPGEPQMGVPLPANIIAPYVWGKEGANWTGQSMLRSCYKPWILKDRALRVDAMKNERFGMGIPVATAPLGATRDTVMQYAAMARAARGDGMAGVGLPNGGSLGIQGVTGNLPDVLASVEYYDMQMARAFLAMFSLLGSTKTGSRALGESFVDFFKMGVDATAGWYKWNTNKHVIENMVDWNYGIDENAPLITWDEDPESRITATDFVALVDAGCIVVDDEVRTWLTDRWGISDPGPGTPTPPGPSPATPMVPSGDSTDPSPAPTPDETEEEEDDNPPTSITSKTKKKKTAASNLREQAANRHAWDEFLQS